MTLQHYIYDKYEKNMVNYYVHTIKSGVQYESRVYPVIDRSYANHPYYDVQWDEVLDYITTNNIFKAILNHNKLIKKWNKK